MAKKIFKILPDSQPNKQKRCGSNGLSSSAMDTLGRLVSAENVQLPPYRALRYSDCGKSLHYGQILWLLRGYDRDRAVYTAAFASQYMKRARPAACCIGTADTHSTRRFPGSRNPHRAFAVRKQLSPHFGRY